MVKPSTFAAPAAAWRADRRICAQANYGENGSLRIRGGPAGLGRILQYITMPYVIGQTVPQVTTALALDSITLGTSAVEASSQPAGTVIYTNPEPGATFPDTEKVNVGVSSGDPGSPPDTVCVPPAGPPASSTCPPPTSPTGPLPTSPVQPSVSP